MRDVAAGDLGDSPVRRIAESAAVGGALLVVAAVAAFVAVPALGRSGFAVAAAALAPVMIVVGVAAHRPRRARSWMLLAVGCGVMAVSTATLLGPLRGVVGDGPAPSRAIGSLAYPALFAGVLGLTASREDGWWTTRTTAIGSAALGAAMVALAVTLPYFLRDELPLAESDWAGMFGLADVVLALLVARRIIGAPRRSWSSSLLLGGFVAWGNAHAEVGTRINSGTFDVDSAIAMSLGVGPVLVGAGALVASMAQVPEPFDRGEVGREIVDLARFVTLSTAVVVVVSVAHVDKARLLLIVPLVVVLTASVCRTAARVATVASEEGM